MSPATKGTPWGAGSVATGLRRFLVAGRRGERRRREPRPAPGMPLMACGHGTALGSTFTNPQFSGEPADWREALSFEGARDMAVCPASWKRERLVGTWRMSCAAWSRRCRWCKA